MDGTDMKYLRILDKEKANVLADFFTSVFTIEGDGKMPDIEKVDVLPLETMIIIRDRPCQVYYFSFLCWIWHTSKISWGLF
jgi:hypothetical protein